MYLVQVALCVVHVLQVIRWQIVVHNVLKCVVMLDVRCVEMQLVVLLVRLVIDYHGVIVN